VHLPPRGEETKYLVCLSCSLNANQEEEIPQGNEDVEKTGRSAGQHQKQVSTPHEELRNMHFNRDPTHPKLLFARRSKNLPENYWSSWVDRHKL
jgi:hypothetical protein